MTQERRKPKEKKNKKTPNIQWQSGWRSKCKQEILKRSEVSLFPTSEIVPINFSLSAAEVSHKKGSRKSDVFDWWEDKRGENKGGIDGTKMLRKKIFSRLFNGGSGGEMKCHI